MAKVAYEPSFLNEVFTGEWFLINSPDLTPTPRKTASLEGHPRCVD